MNTFAEIDLIDPIQRAIADQNYKTPTPVQQQALPPAIEGRDILGSAQTGTGKTAAFSLPILQRLGKTNRKAKPNRPYALVLAPTRELAIQISESLATYGTHLQLRLALVFGGVSQQRQVRQLDRGAHILIATPGRLLDLMNQGYVDLSLLKIFVLDEADRMLDMGFLPDLKRIIKCLPNKRQSMFFSATLPPKIVDLSNSLLNEPFRVSIAPKTKSVDAIKQQVLHVERAGKHAALRDLLQNEGVERAIVFTRTKRGANTLAEKLDRSGIRATAIHGNKAQNARQRALEAFRNNKVRVLVATDVAARGIDVDGVSHVINYDVPDDPDSYIHRIGRTGRAGAEGVAVLFCSHSERAELKAIERLLGKPIPLAPNQPAPPAEQLDSENPRANRFRRPRTDRPQRTSTAKRGSGSERSKGRIGKKTTRRRPGEKAAAEKRDTTTANRKPGGAKSSESGTNVKMGETESGIEVTPKTNRKKKNRKGRNARLREKNKGQKSEIDVRPKA